MIRSSDPNIKILYAAVKQLGKLADEVVFVGGCVTGLLITDTAAPPVRMTKDVDVIVQISTQSDYRTFTKQLRKCGFKEDSRPDAPICRWIGNGVILDVMPTDESIIGFSNRWYQSAFDYANKIQIGGNLSIRLITAPYFLMTRFDAFDSRGNGDYHSSHDIEDIVTVLDGHTEIVEDVANADEFITIVLLKRMRQILNKKNFIQVLSCHLLPDEASQNRGCQ